MFFNLLRFLQIKKCFLSPSQICRRSIVIHFCKLPLQNYLLSGKNLASLLTAWLFDCAKMFLMNA